jgi:hypothetical protein
MANTTANTTATKPAEFTKSAAAVEEFKLIKNIKYGDKVYKIGDKVKVKPEDLEEFKKAGVIKVGE